MTDCVRRVALIPPPSVSRGPGRAGPGRLCRRRRVVAALPRLLLLLLLLATTETLMLLLAS